MKKKSSSFKLDKGYVISYRKLWNTLNSARNLFDRLPNKSTDMKRLAIQTCILANYEDEIIFWTEFRKMTKRLLRNIEFIRECEICKRNPVHVAEHVVFLGAGVINAVGDEGLRVLQGQEVLYIDPICTEETLTKLDSQNTYKEYVHTAERHYEAPMYTSNSATVETEESAMTEQASES